MKLPKNLSALPEEEQIEILIKHYKNAHDVWSTAWKNFDPETLKQWLFLVKVLQYYKDHKENNGA